MCVCVYQLPPGTCLQKNELERSTIEIMGKLTKFRPGHLSHKLDPEIPKFSRSKWDPLIQKSRSQNAGTFGCSYVCWILKIT